MISGRAAPEWKRLDTQVGVQQLAVELIREEVHNGRTVYICSCGLGYDDILIAYACDEYIRTHGVSSEDIIRRAVYNPRMEREATKRTIVAP